MANQSTAATDSRSTLKPPKPLSSVPSTQLIKPEDEEKLSNTNKKLVKKFNEFLKHNSRRNGTHSQKLTKTIRSYIQTEITQPEVMRNNKFMSKTRLSQYDMNIYYQLNLLRDMEVSDKNSK